MSMLVWLKKKKEIAEFYQRIQAFGASVCPK